jgi:hypothetical protein
MPGKPPPEKQCTARSRRTGQRCEAWRVKGSAVCYHHGGVTPRGVEAGAFRHGRYSKSLPDQLTSTYREVLADQQRHDLRDELALSRAKADDILRRMERGESDSLWLLLRDKAREMRRASARGEEGRATRLQEEILSLIESGDEALAWADLDGWLGRIQRLSEADVRIAIAKQQWISAEELMTMMALILDAIRRHVPDEHTQRALGRELRAAAELDNPENAQVMPLRPLPEPAWDETKRDSDD